jgi:hypothetical protein
MMYMYVGEELFERVRQRERSVLTDCSSSSRGDEYFCEIRTSLMKANCAVLNNYNKNSIQKGYRSVSREWQQRAREASNQIKFSLLQKHDEGGNNNLSVQTLSKNKNDGLLYMRVRF